METNKLIKKALNRMCSEWEDEDPQRALYADAAIKQIALFDELCAQKDWSVGVEDVFQKAVQPPDCLHKGAHEGYAHFVYDLMKAGSFHGMAHEDPLGANVLIGSALALFRRLVVEGKQPALLPKALDLMLLQSVAYMGAGARDIARLQLLSIVDLTANVQGEIPETAPLVPQVEAAKFMSDILLRAAPAAFMLSDIFKFENDPKRANASMLLAKTLFDEVLQKGEGGFPGTRVDKVVAMMALSELSLHQGEKIDGIDTLDRAIWMANADEALKDTTQSAYQYVVSVANQRRAQIFMVQEELEAALDHYLVAVQLAKQAFDCEVLNTHYHEHYASLLNELGILYGVQGNLVNAQEVFLLSIDERRLLVAQSDQYNEGLVACLNNMSTLMRRHNKNDVALVYLQDALQIAEEGTLDEELAAQLRGLLEQMKEKSSAKSAEEKDDGFGPN